jgi:hypothetical protein
MKMLQHSHDAEVTSGLYQSPLWPHALSFSIRKSLDSLDYTLGLVRVAGQMMQWLGLCDKDKDKIMMKQ